MKRFFYTWVRLNMVDILFWTAAITIGLRGAIHDWDIQGGWPFVLFLCFYGVFAVYRFARMKRLQQQLIDRCVEAGVDISDILPPGTY